MRLKRLLLALYLIALAKSAYGQNIRYWQIYQGDRNGNGIHFQMTTTAGPHTGCVQYDVDGNIVGTGVACGAGGGVTNIATTSPIGGGPITTTGTITCTTCVTSAASLTSNALMIGGGGQASSTISADTTTTHALFATAGAPAFRAIASGDLPAGTGTVTSIATTSPITGGTITATGTIACATCVTSAASLTDVLPVFGSGGAQGVASGTRSGNTTKVTTSTGTLTSGHCASWDANGNAVDAGLVCTAAAGGPGIVLLEEHTGASVTELDFITCISSTYDEYQFDIIGMTVGTNNAAPFIQFGTGGGPTYDTANNYQWNNIVGLMTGSGGFSSNFQNSSSGIVLFGDSTPNGLHNTATPGMAASFKMFDPGSSSNFKLVSGGGVAEYGTGGRYQFTMGGMWLSTTAATAWRLKVTGAGNFSGTVRCYGIAK